MLGRGWVAVNLCPRSADGRPVHQRRRGDWGGVFGERTEKEGNSLWNG